MIYFIKTASTVIVLLLIAGCVVSKTDSVSARKPSLSVFPSVGVRGFRGETMDANPVFASGASSFSGSAYNANVGSVNYYGTGSAVYSGVSMTRRETSKTRDFAEGVLADMGYPMPQNPDYILAGTYYGPRVDWSRWYVDAAVDVFSLTFLWNVRYKSGLEIRVFDAKTGQQVTKFFEPDSFRFTSFGVIPLYGHLFCPMQWPNTLFPCCNERVTVKALNHFAEWTENKR